MSYLNKLRYTQDSSSGSSKLSYLVTFAISALFSLPNFPFFIICFEFTALILYCLLLQIRHISIYHIIDCMTFKKKKKRFVFLDTTHTHIHNCFLPHTHSGQPRRKIKHKDGCLWARTEALLSEMKFASLWLTHFDAPRSIKIEPFVVSVSQLMVFCYKILAS